MIKVICNSSLAFTAVAEAFKKAGKDAESAEFTCPYCGKKNTAHKYNGNL